MICPCFSWCPLQIFDEILGKMEEGGVRYCLNIEPPTVCTQLLNKFDTNIGLLVGGFKSTIFYLLNIFCISSILFPFVSGTKKNVNSPPARQIAPYSQKVPLPPEHI